MLRPHLHSLRLAFVLAALLLAGGARAQTQASDPRHVEDPRKVDDPRVIKDPRAETRDPFAELQGTELWDALYEAGETGRLKQAFHDNGWRILGYIDGHCEGWLALIENQAAETEDGRLRAAELQAKGRALAALADDALVNTRFGFYVGNFYGWNATQQKTFREGQQLFRQAGTLLRAAKNPQDALAALTPLQQSLSRARELGDTWGQSMALSLIGRIQYDNRQFVDATATLREAVRLAREIRDLESLSEGLTLIFEAGMAQREYEQAHDALKQQYQLALDMNDKPAAELALRKLVEVDKLFGRD